MKKNTSLFYLFLLFFVSSITAAQPPKPLPELFKDLQTKKDTGYVNTLLHIAMTYRMQNKLDSSLHYLRMMLPAAKKGGYKKGEYAAIVSMGDVSLMRANYDSATSNEMIRQALEYYMQARKMLPELDAVDRSNNEARLLMRLGQAYSSQLDYVKAFPYLKDAEKILINTKDSITILDIFHSLVTCYRMKGDSVSAVAYLNRGLDLCDTLEKNRGSNPQMLAYLNKKRVILINNSLDEEQVTFFCERCLQVLEKIWENKELLPDNLYRSGVISNIAALLMFKGEYQRSIKYSLQALKDYPDADIYKFTLYKNLARSYYYTGDYKKGYEYYNLYNAQYVARFKKEKFEALAELDSRYQTEKKEQQIRVLNAQKKTQGMIIGISLIALVVALGLLLFAFRANRLQKKLFAREKELQKKELEKKMFDLEQTALRAQMNPHFIFNSLNSVQRFVINNDAEGVNQYLSTFAALIRQTLENSGKQLIPLKDELHYLETYLRLEQMRSNNKFMYSIRVNEDVDTEDTFIPNMIIQPYLENSVIHGMAGKQKEEGVINLTISKNHKLTCVVEDNGMGFKKSQLAKATETPDHESMGTAITERRIEMFNSMHPEKIELQLDDKSEMDNTAGTRVMIKFPLNSAN